MCVKAAGVSVGDVVLTVGSLFSGIGGLDLGLERAGMTVKWQVEVDSYCSRVLAKHWPQVPNLGDVTTVDWSEVERVDLVCGGFPCQPFSSAGKQLGAADERYMWPEVVRALRVLRPRRVLLENVPGLLHAPEFGTVLGDLADLGYDAEWDSIPAAAVGAPHLRYRVFVVAHHDGAGSDWSSGVQAGRDGVHGDEWLHPRRSRHVADSACDSGWISDGDGPTHVPDSEDASGWWGTFGGPEGNRRPRVHGADRAVADTDDQGPGHGRSGPARWTQSRGGGSRLGHAFGASPDALTEVHRSASESGWWAVEPDVGRVAHGVPSRVDRLRGLGNAVVPQVAQFIGEQLLEQLERGVA